MASEEDIVFRINYQLEGVERSISTSRRALFTLNAIRLSIRDIQQVLSGPTIANVLFTAIQLTRTLTQARRLTKALAREQAATGMAGLLGGGARGFGVARAVAPRAFGAAGTSAAFSSLFGPEGGQIAGPGFFASLSAFTVANPIALGIFFGTMAIGVGAALHSERERRIRREFREYNREVAKAQGLEP